MQKTTDKRIQEKLMEETRGSLKEKLRKSVLSREETNAALETFTNLMEDNFRNIGRVEVFKYAVYPEFIGRKGTREEKLANAKLLKNLEKLTKQLESELGDEFIGISLYGSHAKGYAGKESDVDVILLLRSGYKSWNASDVINKLRGDAVDQKVQHGFKWLDDAKGLIRAVKEENGRVSGDMKAAHDVFTFFSGITFGKGIEGARKELIEELARNRHGEVIWDDIKRLYYTEIIGLMSDGFLIREEKAPKKLGVTVEEFREILNTRKEFALPSFEEMKKKYGVA